MKRILIGVLVVVLVAVGVLYIARERVAIRLMERVIASNMQTSLLAELDDGIHVILCGAGSPLPDPNRSGPCVAVVAGDQLFIVDTGSGASRNLSALRLPQGEIQAVLLTHFHSDHIDGLGELLMQAWAGSGKSSPTPVYGPVGVEQVVAGFNRAYTPDRAYRIAHHGAETVPPGGWGGVARPFADPPEGADLKIYESEGVVITAASVDHEPIHPAVAYRFEYKGRSVVISGDTKKSANLTRFAKDVDLLVHEALSSELVAVITRGAETAGRERLVKITTDILDYHTSPIEAAEVARDANARSMLLYHIVPPLPVAPLEDIFMEGVTDVYLGPVMLGTDGSAVHLKAGETRIAFAELL